MMFFRRKIARVLLFLCAGFLFSTFAVAAQERPISLSFLQALRLTAMKQVDVLVANERVEQALARIRENASPLLPQLKGTISQTRQTRDLRSMGMDLPGDPLVGPFNVYDARVRLTQTLFDPSAISRFKSSWQGHVLSVAQQQKTREDALVLVAALFVEAKRAQDNFGVVQSALHRDKKEVSIAFSRFKLGLSSVLELKKARAKYAHALYRFASAKKEAIERKLDLAAALDLPQDQDIYFVWDDQLFSREIPGVEISQEQPDVKVAQEQLKLDEQEQSANRADFWPKISLFGEYGPSGISSKPGQSSETYALGISAAIPIFEGGLRQAKLEESQNAVRIAQVHLQNVQRQQKAKFFSQYAVLSQAEAFVKENEEMVAVAREEMDMARSKFNFGDGSNLDLSSAQVNFDFAVDQKDEAQAYYLLAKINLARCLGQVQKFLLDESK